MKEQIEKQIKEALKNLGIPARPHEGAGGEDVSFTVEHPEDFKNGDYSTNVAMVCAKKSGKNPRELAEQIVATLQRAQGEFPTFKEIQVAGAGFINFYLSREFFTDSVKQILEKKRKLGEK